MKALANAFKNTQVQMLLITILGCAVRERGCVVQPGLADLKPQSRHQQIVQPSGLGQIRPRCSNALSQPPIGHVPHRRA